MLFDTPATCPPDIALTGKQPVKPAVIKITCKDASQLRRVQAEITAVLARYEGAYLSVSAGAL
ncbi:hypothetical protein [Hymenobacter cheonanensis]|uniref:hypothetical protein n=1 Tax=Hymenobacter sp. CA2-7 TaxID=3063993 RepID=UPI002713C9B9|nr:hypothetical protein [Hymenobacter sp. CA2-7]MDO7888244.1 hypothetical protein [Hymenobacter sp. CA2-7]